MKSENALRIVTTTVLALLLAAPAASQQSAHVHGDASGTLSLDNGKLRLELELPGYNLVGFEHPPRNPDQAEALQRATVLLENGQWLEVDPGADCQLGEFDAHVHGFDEPAHDDDHGTGHDHDGEHEDEHDHSAHAGSEHASFHVLVEWDCQHPTRLTWMDLKLFDDFPNQSSITVDVLTDRIATRARLRPDAVRIDLASP